MATEPETIIPIPELDRPNDLTGAGGTLRAQLHLTTVKSFSGPIDSNASVHYLTPDNMLTFCTDDWRKNYARLKGARGTQKVFDTRHAEIFTPDFIESIKSEVRTFYAMKRTEEEQRIERGRQDTSNGLGAAVKELMDEGIDASTALRMCNAD